MISEEVASGIISNELKVNGSTKKDIDDEIKYIKGMLNQSYSTFLDPILNEVSKMLSTIIKSER